MIEVETTNSNKQDNHADYMQYLERSVKPLPDVIERGDEEQVCRERADEAGEMHRLRELLCNGEGVRGSTRVEGPRIDCIVSAPNRAQAGEHSQ